ncbi:MAG: porin [Proteobacteria bacterium]|nr:porin [Pseudomonadota bacterium]
MKKGLLGTTALVGASVILAAAAQAAEAPTWKLSGNANFQLYWVDQDNTSGYIKTTVFEASVPVDSTSGPKGTYTGQDHDWYFGVDEAELQLNVSGAADNGLNYGFKIEINANTTDGTVADEARLQLSGGWGTLQMGDEDGAEDIMNYGGENLMGATGGFDGDQDDYKFRAVGIAFTKVDTVTPSDFAYFAAVARGASGTKADLLGAPSYPTIAGDTGDATKVSYFSPRFSGFQVGASITPTPNTGDNFKEDGEWENHIGVGANYDNSFGDLRVRASLVYSAASWTDQVDLSPKGDIEDISAWSVGGIVNYGPFSLGANYTDNGDSGRVLLNFDADDINVTIDSGESSYWDVAAGYEAGPMYFSAGYFLGTREFRQFDATYQHIALTADYTVAPGLGVYAEVNLIEDDFEFKSFDTTSFVLGANISF